MDKAEFTWLTKKIEDLSKLRDSGISKEFDDLVERAYWKFRNRRERLVDSDKTGVVS